MILTSCAPLFYDLASRRRAAEQRHELMPFELTELHALSVAGDCVTA